MSGKKDKGTRICPLCAETVKADAPRCRFCGSTLFAADLSFPGASVAASKGKDGNPKLEEALPVEGRGDDVGLAGVAAVVGAIGTYGVFCWFLTGAALGGLVVVGAVASLAAAKALRRSA